jgi:hypothetical protein
LYRRPPTFQAAHYSRGGETNVGHRAHPRAIKLAALLPNDRASTLGSLPGFTGHRCAAPGPVGRDSLAVAAGPRVAPASGLALVVIKEVSAADVGLALPYPVDVGPVEQADEVPGKHGEHVRWPQVGRLLSEDREAGQRTPEAYGAWVADTILPNVLRFIPGTNALWDPWNGIDNGKSLSEPAGDTMIRMVLNQDFVSGLSEPTPLLDYFPYVSPPPAS